MRRPPVRGTRALGAIAPIAATDALARAGGGGHGGGGGGHSSSGGGGHSFGSGGGGGSVGGLITLLIIGLIFYVVFKRMNRGGAARAGSFGGARPGGSPPAQVVLSALGAALGQAATRGAAAGVQLPGASTSNLPATVEQIRAQDPGFELEVFLQRAEMIFFLVKRGVQQNDAAAVRPYLGDAVFAAVASGITQAKTGHRHALLESLNVRALHVQNADCAASTQSIQIHFDLVYRAKMLSDANQVISDEGDDHRHGERWTFTRAANARTPLNGGVVAAKCPACGAELRLNLDGTCAHCRASVTNGTVDWIVSDVQNAPFMGYSGDSSLAVAAASVEEGIASLRAADPSFVLEAFLARVNAAFLALQDAWCKQNLDAGRGFLSPGAYFTWRAQLETLASEGRRNVMEHLSVQRIDPVLLVHGRVFDDLTVRITASCADFEIDKDNEIVFGDRTVRSFTEDWTFQRSVGVSTSRKPGTLENTCPSCGAPVSLNQIGECRYCRAAVTSGKFDWVVSRIEQDEEGSSDGGTLQGAGAALALQVGGAIVGGLLGNLISNAARKPGDWN